MQSPQCFTTEPNDTLTELNCKLVASVESSSQNCSTESKVQEYFHFGQGHPFPEHHHHHHTPKDLDRLEEQLNNIDRLKRNYESKNDRTRNFNTQNSEKSRSIEKKHILKPSQTPYFTRRFETHRGDEETKGDQSKIQPNLQQSSARSSRNCQTTILESTETELLELRRELSKLQEELASKNRVIDGLSETIYQLRREKENGEEDIGGVKEDNRIMKLDLQRIKLEKEQLETILKDLLFEREREKLFGPPKEQRDPNPRHTLFTNNSTVTSSRKSFTPGRCTVTRPSPRDQNISSNLYTEKGSHSGNKPSYREKQRVKERQALEEIEVNEQPREKEQREPRRVDEQKKMKVQNILDKLKIKINKN